MGNFFPGCGVGPLNLIMSGVTPAEGFEVLEGETCFGVMCCGGKWEEFFVLTCLGVPFRVTPAMPPALLYPARQRRVTSSRGAPISLCVCNAKSVDKNVPGGGPNFGWG